MNPRPPTHLASLVIHGHFYQPPRENPFLDEVEAELSAGPYHDWNQRIERECYRAVVAARVTGHDGRIARIVNTLEWISFNFGPTLLEWLEREANDTYRSILAADDASRNRLAGHGNAIAQPYHHTILPLASRRDKQTEVRWGMADFRRRYGREPEGMWLPETAVDDETLDVLAAEGIRFTILAPHQLVPVPPLGRPGRYRTSGGRSIALFTYDGSLSHGIAFGGLLHDADAWVSRMATAGSHLAMEDGVGDARAAGQESPQRRAPEEDRPTAAKTPELLLAMATDGETYGHHHRFGEMALAHAVEKMRAAQWRVENFASFLARSPATVDVAIVTPSAWSCVHGVERWRSNCGCRLDGGRNPSQAWRAPLRQGLEKVAARVHAVFEEEGRALFDDPWRVRDGYGAVVAGGADELARFAGERVRHPASVEQLVRARELLEMERDTLRMFTSCAWFFDDIGGLEARQVLRYAARAIDLAGRDRDRLEVQLLDELSMAGSNDAALGSGSDVYRAATRVAAPAPVRIAAAAMAGLHAGAQAVVRTGNAEVEIAGDTVRVTESRTGRRHQLRARVVRSSHTEVVTEVADEQDVRYRLSLADLPERPRHAIRSRLRRSILPGCLTPGEIDLLLVGDVTLGGLVRVALVRTVKRLEQDHDGEALQLVNALLDLIEQSEGKVPFDAQTAFWRIWQRANRERRADLHELHVRLGFVDSETGDA